MEAKEFKGLMEAYASVYEQTEVLSEETIEEKKIATGTGKKVMPSAEERSKLAKKARAGEDIGKKGKGFEAVAAKAAKQYGSEEAGKRVAAAAMFKQQAKEEVEYIDERKYEADEKLPSGKTPNEKMERAQGKHGANYMLSKGGGRNNPARDSHFDRGTKVKRIKDIVTSGGDPRNDSRVGPGWDNDARKIGRTQNPTGGTRRRNESDNEKSNYSQGGLRAHKTKAGGYRTLVRKEEFEGDIFDYLLEHLVAEGYADTNQAALAIMANMSEEWKQSIVEAVYGGGESPTDTPADKKMVVTAADKKANTPAWQRYQAGNPAYKPAAHLKGV